MKLLLATLLAICIYSDVALGQVASPKRAFVSSNLEYLEFINDSTIWTSIENDGDTTSYLIQAGVLLIKDDYWQTGADHQTYYMVNWHGYKILKNDDDTLLILNHFKGDLKPMNREDTLKFISLERLKEPIKSFQYLKVSYENPFSGGRDITVDNTGKIIYQKGEIKPPLMKEVFKTITGKLSKSEFDKFIDTLSYSLPNKLTEDRSGCDGTDGSYITFEIRYNNKTIKSKGCTLAWTHVFLLNYLYDLENNSGFMQEKKK